MRIGVFICVLLLVHFTKLSSQQDYITGSAPAIVVTTPNSVPATQIQPQVLLDVLFATNEDCDLFIDNEPKGLLSKDQFRYLQLTPGRHTYRARSKGTLDELSDTFNVAAGKANEIFIDLLYWVDERNAQREKLKSETQLVVQKTAPDTKKKGDSQPDIKNVFVSKDAEREVYQSLAGNMVKIKGGSFVMGNNRSPLKDELEHSVVINSIFFSKYEVTQHQWETIMGYNPSFNRNCGTCPVENVSWEEVMRFVRKLNIISNKKFRLPTEAEWEYVARLGGKLEIDTAGGQEAYIKKTAWFFANANRQTHPVGLRQPNVAGIFDMMGNVSEWCLDWYSANYSKEEFSQLNPEGPPLGKEKVVRGGNYKDYLGDRFRPSLRSRRIPVEKGSELGFRLVMEVSD